jgi:hypothetical protein
MGMALVGGLVLVLAVAVVGWADMAEMGEVDRGGDAGMEMDR